MAFDGITIANIVHELNRIWSMEESTKSLSLRQMNYC